MSARRVALASSFSLLFIFFLLFLHFLLSYFSLILLHRWSWLCGEALHIPTLKNLLRNLGLQRENVFRMLHVKINRVHPRESVGACKRREGLLWKRVKETLENFIEYCHYLVCWDRVVKANFKGVTVEAN